MLIRPSTAFATTARLTPDPPELRGALFQQEPDGTVKILRTSGQTSPDGPPDIPIEALHQGEVFLSVNGIDQDWQGHQQQIKDWYHGGFSNGANWNRPVIGIHEGDRPGAADIGRVFKNTMLLKRLQAHLGTVEAVKQAAYNNDPSVKAIHDQVRQSLAAGRQVTLMAHSGGGSQVALALTLLSREGEGAWADEITSKVRVMGTAATATRGDFERAGVKDENLFLTSSQNDAVPAFYRTDTDLKNPISLLRGGVRGLSLYVKNKFQLGQWHEGHYIFSQNDRPGGNRIVDFLNGAPGGSYPIA